MRKLWWLRGAVALHLIVALSACGRSEKRAEDARQYQTRGIIRGLPPDHRTIEIEHETIAGFMPSMTMPFSAGDPKELAPLSVGDAIAFRLDVTAKDFSIVNVKKIDASEVRLPATAAIPSLASRSGDQQKLKEGDPLPAFSLTSETGETITGDALRGHPTILTFIFTRCPMPNFCPRISKNFSALQKAIKDAGSPAANTELLSITIDPQFDTPAVLRQYAQQEGADPQIWHFATGEPREIDKLTSAFAVYRQNEGGTISHGLTTALITPDHKIAKLWRGNDWTVDEVLRAVQELKISSR